MLWSISRINHLGSLLKLARDSGRVVVLASDHGHVWHRPDATSYSSDEGSRWRANTGEPRDGEILLTGDRVRDDKGQQAVIAPGDDVVRRCLEALNGSGGIMTPTAFSKAADVPAARLDGLIARIQRLLNVDGYEILTLSRSENRIELNVVKLKRQFDLE